MDRREQSRDMRQIPWARPVGRRRLPEWWWLPVGIVCGLVLAYFFAGSVPCR